MKGSIESGCVRGVVQDNIVVILGLLFSGLPCLEDTFREGAAFGVAR